MDKKAKIWQENVNSGKFDLIGELSAGGNAHDDWVRDVAWCSNIGTMRDMIATCGEDQKLKIWKNDFVKQNKDQNNWQLAWEESFPEPVWKCSWSPVGFMLAVSSGDN